ncbi:MAG: hypothetical protein A3J83_05440 [Elusimicrobia bacterium RIFOXYA2_FULL_40_6]|nr:MAG: hypothetical protein A3J83_05440 [Elusimicrobia bacterium RIFOXYA2_FULL_40_6]
MPEKKENLDERRKYQRVNFACSITIRGASGKFHAVTRNISREGLSFESQDLFAVKEKYVFEFSSSSGPVFKLKGEIFWTMPSKDAHLYGVKFTSLGIFCRWKLKSLVDKLINEEEKGKF